MIQPLGLTSAFFQGHPAGLKALEPSVSRLYPRTETKQLGFQALHKPNSSPQVLQSDCTLITWLVRSLKPSRVTSRVTFKFGHEVKKLD